jgi:hypothetical protein
MDPKAPHFDDPESAGQCFLRQRANQRAEQLVEHPGGRLSRESQNRNPCEIGWSVLKWIGEIEIQCNQRAPLALAVKDQLVVQGRLQALLRDCADVVASSVQPRPRRFTQVLVKLEFHAVSSIGIGT